MKPSDFTIIFNGLEIVTRAFVRLQEKELEKFWKNSSLRTISKSVATSAEESISSAIASSSKGNVSYSYVYIDIFWKKKCIYYMLIISTLYFNTDMNKCLNFFNHLILDEKMSIKNSFYFFYY